MELSAHPVQVKQEYVLVSVVKVLMVKIVYRVILYVVIVLDLC